MILAFFLEQRFILAAIACCVGDPIAQLFTFFVLVLRVLPNNFGVVVETIRVDARRLAPTLNQNDEKKMRNRRSEMEEVEGLEGADEEEEEEEQEEDSIYIKNRKNTKNRIVNLDQKQEEEDDESNTDRRRHSSRPSPDRPRFATISLVRKCKPMVFFLVSSSIALLKLSFASIVLHMAPGSDLDSFLFAQQFRALALPSFVILSGVVPLPKLNPNRPDSAFQFSVLTLGMMLVFLIAIEMPLSIYWLRLLFRAR